MAVSNRDGAPPDNHAIVIGGSMAGMLAARVLAEHFQRVTIIERDRLPDQVEPRKGTPQSRHLHVLLERGRQVLQRLFPGLDDALFADGASLMDTAADLALLNPAGWAVQFASGIPLLACSRDLLDWHVRRRLQERSNVVFIPETSVTRLVADAAGTGVCGLELRRRGRSGSDAGHDESLSADLVVDAGGRGSQVPDWLASLGYVRPEETLVNAHLGYASRIYRRPSSLALHGKGIFVQAAPPRYHRAGVAFPIEGDRWIVTLSGGDADYPPTDEPGFLRFLQSLRSPILFEAIRHAEPLSPIYGCRGLENRLRHFERMPRWPERFVVLGDAACAFNPVYGQGMTIAALSAVTLDQCLHAQSRRQDVPNLTGLARRFQKELARVVATPWLLATSEDLRYRSTVGKQPSRFSQFMHRYMDYVLRLVTKSTAVRRRTLRVFHLLCSPLALFHPGTVVRVAWQSLLDAAGSLCQAVSRKYLPLPSVRSNEVPQ